MLTWTPLGNRQLVKFFDPFNPSNSYTPQLNPTQQVVTPSTLRKYQLTTNATSVIIGGNEAPPKELKLSWKQIDISDYHGISQFTQVNPCVYIDNNDNGYFGNLVINQAQQVAGKTSNVWAVEASFLILSPYNGQHTTLNVLTPPTITLAGPTGGGYLNTGNVFYVWPTVFTPWGESLVGTVLTVTASGSNVYYTVNWTNPTSQWFRRLRLYWSNVNNSVNSVMLFEQLGGLTPQFNLYTPYVQYSTLTPPSINRAFTGYWSGGSFVQTT